MVVRSGCTLYERGLIERLVAMLAPQHSMRIANGEFWLTRCQVYSDRVTNHFTMQSHESTFITKWFRCAKILSQYWACRHLPCSYPTPTLKTTVKKMERIETTKYTLRQICWLVQNNSCNVVIGIVIVVIAEECHAQAASISHRHVCHMCLSMRTSLCVFPHELAYMHQLLLLSLLLLSAFHSVFVRLCSAIHYGCTFCLLLFCCSTFICIVPIRLRANIKQALM